MGMRLIGPVFLVGGQDYNMTYLDWPANVWMGVSVENARAMSRVADLRTADGPVVRFLSCEPLLGPLLALDLTDIDWVIVGGESGPGARPMDEEWVLSIRDRCLSAAVPFFFKQWGGTRKKKAGRMLEGRAWSEVPVFAAMTMSNQLEAAV